MSATRHMSPPKAWLLALVLTLPMSLPLFFPLTFVDPVTIEGVNEHRYRHELAAFLNADREEGQRPKGVMLTMSGGSCATTGPLRLAADGVDLYVAYYPEGTAATFRGLLDVLIDGNPDFIVIQDSVLVFSRPVHRARVLYDRARSHWRQQINGIAQKLNSRADDLAANDSWRCRTYLKKQSMWAQDVQRSMASIRPYSEWRHAEAVAFLNEFLRAGIPVIVASPPENSFTAEYRQEVFQVASEIVNENPVLSTVSLHRQPGLTPADHFYDPFHLAREANQPYRAWLNNEIVQVYRVRKDQ